MRAAAAGIEAGQRLVGRRLEGRLHLDVVLGEELLGDIGAVLAVPAEIVERPAELLGASRRSGRRRARSAWPGPAAPWMKRRRLRSALSLLSRKCLMNSFTVLSLVCRPVAAGGVDFYLTY